MLTISVAGEYLDISLIDGSTPHSIEAVDGQTWQFTCTSIGARPALDLLWFHRKSTDPEYTQILSGFYQIKTPNEMDNATYDTSNVLLYGVHKSYNLGEIKCQTSGQLIVPSVADIINLEVYCKSISEFLRFHIITN